MGDFPAYFREETIAWRAERDRTNPILTREQSFAREALRTSVAEFVKLKSGFALGIKDRGRRLGSLVARGWLSETEITRAFLQAADRSGIFARETEKALQAYLNEGLRIGFKSPAPDLDEPPEKSEPEKPEDAHSKSEDTSIDPIKALEEMNEIYASVSIGGKFRVMTFGPHALYSLQVNPVFSTKQDFCNHVRTPKILTTEKAKDGTDQKVRKARGDWWLNQPNHRRFDEIDFIPGEPAVITVKDRKTPGRMITRFNMYCGFSITPKAGDCSLYLKHVLDHICQGERSVFDYVMAWMASGVQQPGNPARIALSLRGKPGVGKGIFATEYGHIFGRHFLHLTNRAHVTGRFNAHSAEAVLIFADEALFVGDARDADIIKTLISETTKMLERKGIDAVPVRNYGRFIFATNHDHALRIDVHDRRNCALHVTIPDSMIGAAGAKTRRDYFIPILEQMKNGGRAALLHYLLQYDLKNFNPEAIPQTEELAKQKLLSAHPGDQFIISLAHDGFLPGGLVAQPWIARAHMDNDRGGLLDHMKRRSGRTLEHATDNVLSEILKRWGFEKKHLKDGSAWIAPNLDVLRAKIKETYPAVTWPDNETQWGLAG